MDSLSDVFGLCRLCLVQEHVNIPIFDDPDNVRQIPLKISSCLPVQVSREDNLPKKICDECSNKLDLCYDFWTSTANAEKTLLSTVEKQNQAPEPAAFQLFKTEPEYVAVPEEETQSQIPEPQVPEPILIKAESEEIEAPPAKRPRQSAAIKAQMHMAPESDDDEVTADQDFNGAEDEVEEEIDDPDVPDMSVDIDEVKPGTSGLNLEIADSKVTETIYLEVEEPGAAVQLPEKRIIPRLMHWCHICGKCFNRKLDLNKHFAFVHFGDKRHQCKHCGSNYKEEEALLNHIKRSHKEEKRIDWMLCETCGATCSDSLYLKRHREETHSHPNRITCEWCHEDFTTESAFKKHFKQHTREFVKSCHQCQQSFYSLSKYDRHMRACHSDNFLACRYCRKLFVSKTRLSKHEPHCAPPELEECPVCQKRLKNLKKHLAEVHFLEDDEEVEEKKWECHVCGAHFKLEQFLKRHMTKHVKQEIEA